MPVGVKLTGIIIWSRTYTPPVGIIYVYSITGSSQFAVFVVGENTNGVGSFLLVKTPTTGIAFFVL
jgi:hypothetical protein